MTDRPRLIEAAFPLKQTSIDSVHEKNVRHGHISTLHIWPARRPLAACRAAVIATLLGDPGDPEGRRKLVERIGGKVVMRTKNKAGKTVNVEETEGGVLHWGREASPDMTWFREEIRKAYGGRAPHVLDPFAGGGAIPLEAMRLGCEVTAIDVNPVAWFILKCTLEYPQKLAGKTFPLPKFALESPEFMAEFRKGAGKAQETGKKGRRAAGGQTAMFAPPDVDLGWHVRAWGHWVLRQAKADLEPLYPVIDSRPTVAYLWARTVTCKSCRATIPLLKTRWLCHTDEKRVVLTMTPRADGCGVTFGLAYPSSSQARDRKLAKGTMSKAGAQCPCCPVIMTTEDIRLEAKAGRLASMSTAIVVDGPSGKEYRLPDDREHRAALAAEAMIGRVFAEVPFGLPDEPINTGSIKKGGVSVTRWGVGTWKQLFTPRQLVAIGTFVRYSRAVASEMTGREYPQPWVEAVSCYLAAMVDRLADYASTVVLWGGARETLAHTFTRFALPMTWDYAEVNAIGERTGGYPGALEWVARTVDHFVKAGSAAIAPQVQCHSVLATSMTGVDMVLTDPPYYDEIPYADLMDFFHVWARRVLWGLPGFEPLLSRTAGPKWDHRAADGEIIDDESRFSGDSGASKLAYENAMAKAFEICSRTLKEDGRFVIVFAHKKPDAWEALVSAMIRAGLVVDGSWPIVTEMRGGVRNFGRASLSSSVWLVCKKRAGAARPGWDNRVLEEMRDNIRRRLRDFWDAGIRGPDFVWAATGPAMEAYSKHPVVKKANEPGQVMDVGEFLRHVRRIVVDFVVGRVLTHEGGAESVAGLDDVTTYYLLHRHDFGTGDAPAGACILYAVSCGLADRDLSDQWDLLVRTGAKAGAAERDEDEESDDEDDEESGGGSGSKVKLKSWDHRHRKGMGYDAEARPAPLIDQVHKLMHLWRAGDAPKVDEYLDTRVLRKNQLFHQLLQALVELAPGGSEERALLESISNHVSPRGQTFEKRQVPLPIGTASDS